MTMPWADFILQGGQLLMLAWICRELVIIRLFFERAENRRLASPDDRES